MERVKNISVLELKTGQFVQLADKRIYVVVKHGQSYHYIPVILAERISVSIYDLNQPKICGLYNKNGDCIKLLEEEEK